MERRAAASPQQAAFRRVFSGLQGRPCDRRDGGVFFAAGLSGRFLRSGRDLGSDAGSDERTIVRIAGNAAQGRFRKQFEGPGAYVRRR